jgi:hypothetical protein
MMSIVVACLYVVDLCKELGARQVGRQQNLEKTESMMYCQYISDSVLLWSLNITPLKKTGI